ncbi:hypothetical protein FRC01_011059 [Tulasnella sp. 417]|nr:hypothetical protein FRC01_011059 [Tulasnella sp. 417]
MEQVTLSSIGATNVATECTADPTSTNPPFPSEMFVNIFDVLYWSITEPLPFPLPYDDALKYFKRHPLLDYMLVCRRWYNIVQASPSYWTFVEMGVTSGVAREGCGAGHHNATPPGQGELIDAQKPLERSGSLPLRLTVAPEFFSKVGWLEVIRKHARRLESLDLVYNPKNGTIRRISPEHLVQLLELPFLSLKRLHLGRLYFTLTTLGWSDPFQINLNAPHLHQLSYHFQLIIPSTPSRLTFLSISGSDFSLIKLPIGQSQIELPELLELRITDCEPAPVLSVFSTPALQALAINADEISAEVPEDLPEYPHLRDLQWLDVGNDQTFELVFRHCPNLTRYANYVVGSENKLNPKHLTDGPTILERPGGINSIGWPKLEEVLLDCALCVDLLGLAELVPTIKRMRILKNPCEFGDKIIEAELLVQLRQKVDIAIGIDSWTDS